MANISTTIEKAVKRLNDKISEAKDIDNKIVENINGQEYQTICKDYITWRTSCFNTLRQIFSDEILASRIFGDENIITQIKESKEGRELKNYINIDIKRIRHTIDDLNDNIYVQSGDKEAKIAKIGSWQTIIVALITTLGGIITGYIAIPHKIDPIEKQGLENLSIEGKWKYICTSFDGSYQHGGRLIIQKDNDGSLILNGERMWRDTKDTVTGKWTDKTFQESDYLLWHSNWIFVKNSYQMNFEYEIPMQSRTITGYCTGILNSDHGVVKSLKGNFYVLNDKPILTGQIIFKRVTDENFDSASSLAKNHD